VNQALINVDPKMYVGLGYNLVFGVRRTLLEKLIRCFPENLVGYPLPPRIPSPQCLRSTPTNA